MNPELLEDDEDPPPISRGVERAIAELEAIRELLADEAPVSTADARNTYRSLAPKLEHLERFRDMSPEHVAELRRLLALTSDLRDRVRRC